MVGSNNPVLIDDNTLGRFGPVVTKMKSYGVKSVLVEFYGGGDSGQVENIELDPQPPAQCKMDVVEEKYCRKFDESTGEWKYEKEEFTKRLSLDDAVEALTYQALEDVGVDWYNNEGGGGSLEIDLRGEKPQIKFHVFYNVIESVTEVDVALDIEL